LKALQQANPPSEEFSQIPEQTRSVVPKMCSTDIRGFETSSHGTGGYISVMITLKFDVLLKINPPTSLIGERFISYDRYI